MWIMGTFGFISAVEHRDNPERVLVRARDRKSLETLLDTIEVAGAEADANGKSVEKLSKEDIRELGPKEADYRYRIEMSKATLALAVQFEILNFLTYHNFKNEVTHTRGQGWHDLYMEVWLAMRDADDKSGALAHGKKPGVHVGTGSWL